MDRCFLQQHLCFTSNTLTASVSIFRPPLFFMGGFQKRLKCDYCQRCIHTWAALPPRLTLSRQEITTALNEWVEHSLWREGGGEWGDTSKSSISAITSWSHLMTRAKSLLTLWSFQALGAVRGGGITHSRRRQAEEKVFKKWAHSCRRREYEVLSEHSTGRKKMVFVKRIRCSNLQ